MPFGSFSNGHQTPDIAPDALNRRILDELNTFNAWLQANSARGYIGEIGWPSGSEVEKWNNLAVRYYERLQFLGLEACTWASGAVLEENSNLRHYYSSGGGLLDSTGTTAAPTELYSPRPSTNLVGAAWGRGNIGAGVFSNLNPGTIGVNYYYPGPADYTFLASRGIKRIRFSFRWERLQRTLNGSLDTGELDQIKLVLSRAAAQGMDVILEPHNFCLYVLGTNISTASTLTLTTDSNASFKTSHLVDFWTKISTALKGSAGLYAYNLMNEPSGMSAFGGKQAPQVWEEISQAVVTAIRNNTDTTLIMVPGYNFSRVATWVTNHPTGWITDSANNYMYEAHHYWDKTNGGQYPNSYDNNNAAAQAQGY